MCGSIRSLKINYTRMKQQLIYSILNILYTGIYRLLSALLTPDLSIAPSLFLCRILSSLFLSVFAMFC